MMEQRQFLLALHLTKGIGPANVEKILAVWDREPVKYWSYPWDLEQLAHILIPVKQTIWQQIVASYPQALEDASRIAVPYITYCDSQYPQQLREMYHPPLALFYQGDLQSLQLPSLSVVGTRTATPYGLSVVRELLPPIIHSGVAIVSGLARGIDVMAHQVTFAQQGVPIAVIGTGIDVVYPTKNAALQALIGEQGLLLSEYPPGTGPQRSHFPARNRIIAGLSSATLVIEAQKRSGSLITANLALQNNRDVLAVPGPIFSENSIGTNELLKAGATLVNQSQDIMTSVQAFDNL